MCLHKNNNNNNSIQYIHGLRFILFEDTNTHFLYLFCEMIPMGSFLMFIKHANRYKLEREHYYKC